MGNDYPNSRLYLCNVPFSKDYEHTIDFPNFTTQFNYFSSVSSKSYQNFSYIRETGTIQVDEYKENILNNNYLIFWNNDKWYFAFIDRIEYINNSCSEIFFTIDVFQTYLFNFRFVSCFVEREHVSDDTIGLHTVPENLETGEYITNYVNQEPSITLSYKIVIASTISLGKSLTPDGGGLYNRIYSGVSYYAYDNQDEVNKVLKRVAEAGKSDAINSIFLVPSKFITSIESNKKISNSSGSVVFNWNNLTKPSNLAGYTPKNNKLFTYPYCYINASNHVGSNTVYRYEDFSTSNINFDIEGAITPGMSIKLIPKNYKNKETNYIEGLNLGKFPICSWQTDVYTNWLTQNSVNIETKTLENLVNTGLNTLTSSNVQGITGSLVSGYFNIRNIMNEKYIHSLQPPQSNGNLNSGDVTFSSYNMSFILYHMCIKPEYSKIIDNYFSMYGYQVNDVKVPNVNTRPNWNYLKTTGTTVRANIPQNHLDTLNSIFNKGITIWHSPNVIYNYNLNNK